MNRDYQIFERRQLFADWMNYRILRWLFGRYVFKSPEAIIAELLRSPPEPFRDIISIWCHDDPYSHRWGRQRAHIRIILYYTVRNRWYPYYPNHDVGFCPYPHQVDDLVDRICDGVEAVIHK